MLNFMNSSYIDKLRKTAAANIVGIWPQSERSGSVSKDRSRHAHNGAYTAVAYGASGILNSGKPAITYDGTTSFNNIYSAGLANDNLLINGGFETAGAGGADIWTGWTETAGDGALANEITLVHEGSDAAKMTAGATANTKLSQAYTSFVPGKRYRLRFFTRGDGTYAGRYSIFDNSNSAPIIAATATGVTGTTYTMVTYEFVAPAGCTSITFQLWCPSTNTGIAYFDACEVRSMDGFLGDEGTLLAWAKYTGTWAAADVGQVLYVVVDANNYVQLSKSAPSIMGWAYKAGGVLEQGAVASYTNLNWVCYAMTWSKSGDTTKYYIDGVANPAADTVLGTWIGNLGATTVTVGSASTTASNVWTGSIGPVALWNKALTANQILYLSRP